MISPDEPRTTPEDGDCPDRTVATVLELHAAGKPIGQISKAVERSDAVVKFVIQRQRLPARELREEGGGRS
jgi:hypothetical protein